MPARDLSDFSTSLGGKFASIAQVSRWTHPSFALIDGSESMERKLTGAVLPLEMTVPTLHIPSSEATVHEGAPLATAEVTLGGCQPANSLDVNPGSNIA